VHLKLVALERAAIPYVHDEDDGQGEYEKYPAALLNLLHDGDRVQHLDDQ
jgi:hypothetical protein